MPTSPRFYTMQDVAEALAVSVRQVRTLLVNGDLLGIQVGGKGQWRIEHDELENYIERQYAAQRAKAGNLSHDRDDMSDRTEHDNASAT